MLQFTAIYIVVLILDFVAKDSEAAGLGRQHYG